MAHLIAKVLVGGALAAMATAVPVSADEYLGFGGPAVEIDLYNGALAVPPSAFLRRSHSDSLPDMRASVQRPRSL